MLTDREIARMRKDIGRTLPESANVLRQTPRSDGMGGQVVTWTVIETVPCRATPIVKFDREEASVGGKITATGDYQMELPWDADVRPDDRIQTLGTLWEIINRSIPMTEQLKTLLFARRVE